MDLYSFFFHNHNQVHTLIFRVICAALSIAATFEWGYWNFNKLNVTVRGYVYIGHTMIRCETIQCVFVKKDNYTPILDLIKNNELVKRVFVHIFFSLISHQHFSFDHDEFLIVNGKRKIFIRSQWTQKETHNVDLRSELILENSFVCFVSSQHKMLSRGEFYEKFTRNWLRITQIEDDENIETTIQIRI